MKEEIRQYILLANKEGEDFIKTRNRKMKIVMFVYNNFLNDSRVLKEAESLSNAGYIVKIIAVLDGNTLEYEEIRNFEVFRVGNKQPQKGMSFLRNNRFTRNFYIILSKVFNLLNYYWKSFVLVKGEKADVYHSHDLNTLFLAYMSAKFKRARIVYDSHELFVERNTLKPNRLSKHLLRILEGYLIKRVDKVITVNESISCELSKRYSIEKPEIVMNVPPLSWSVFEEKDKLLRNLLKVKKDHILIIYTGSFTFNRGLEKIIESLTYLPNCHLVLLGYGSEKYKDALSILSKKIGVDNRFSFFGPVHSEHVIKYVSEADIGIVPIENSCLSYYYCLPNKFFEYLLAGLPIAASNFPELTKIINKYNLGTTFDPANPFDIASSIQSILRDKKEIEEIKKRTKVAARDYNWEIESVKLTSIYEKILT